jgi:hypothetical protein
MSGGHYNYVHYQISNLADEMLSDIHNSVKGIIDYDITHEDIEIIKGIELLAENMKIISEQCRLFDFYMSGDTGKESLKKEIQNWPTQILNVYNKE